MLLPKNIPELRSKVNRAQVKEAANILNLMAPIIIEIMMDNGSEDWGNIYYPEIKTASTF